jgi:hypothetical protein
MEVDMNVPFDRREQSRPEPDQLRDPVTDWEAFHAARAAHRARLAESSRRHRPAPPATAARSAR